MSTGGFPFPALVGLDTLKMALLLAAIDQRVSVLSRGDKGAAKTTAARGLAALLDEQAPFVNLPIGATEDRLLGGLDLEKAMKGEPALRPGVLSTANGGVLYIDEINLLPDHLADALLDTSASGVHVVEREGFSVRQAANFVLVGSMNPEEGALRPQLLDRFALCVDVSAPVDPAVRRQVVERRLRFDADPVAFEDEWREARQELAGRVARARTRVAGVLVPSRVLDLVAARVTDLGVRSLRADLAIVRASRALAALEGADAVGDAHVEAVIPLALAHRARQPQERPQPPSPPPGSGSRPDDGDAASPGGERIFPSVVTTAPRLVVDNGAATPGASSMSDGSAGGVTIRSRPSAQPRELDARATLIHAVSRAGDPALQREDLHERVRAPRSGTRFIVIVDASGSHGVQERMRAVKGAVAALLEGSVGRRDEAVVIACRGAMASVLTGPTTAAEDVQRALEYLPTGGRTPLAHALELAAGYVTDVAALILVTDGHANVPVYSDDPWVDALTAAGQLRCPAVVIDSEGAQRATGRPRQLADALGATYARLDDLDQTGVLHLMGRSS